MTDLPTGTITFLFTDIEGSTRLWEKYPEAMKAALARHDAILREVIESHRGQIVKSTGDGLHALFTTPVDAVTAVAAGQRALAAEAWQDIDALRVRMALHTGTAEHRAGDYYGPVLNRAARLMSVAHGEQMLLSSSTADLVRDQLPSEMALRDLGEHRLKDLTRPEHVYQLVVADLPSDFPPLASLESFPHNLPVQLTSFVGREREMLEVKRLLAATHLLTLTGPGGTGKTRLALQVAADVLHDFRDGVWLVELAPVANPLLVPQSIAAALGVREQPGRALVDVLVDYLHAKHVLLLLDNCEHLVEACAQLATTVLQACPHLKLLASSREVLGIAGETGFRVPPLTSPDPQQFMAEVTLPAEPQSTALTQYDAVILFLDRARAVQPQFALTQQNAASIAQICLRLDGIPLAIELAAARLQLFSPEQIAARLDDRFRLLTGGSRTALPRHQTLRALIDWSYDLLSEPERLLLRRLSVFAGGWSFEAAESIWAAQDDERSATLELLAQLISKSLVAVDQHTNQNGAVRYHFLETIRQYAQDRLLESSESESVRDRHLQYFLRLAESADPELRGAGQLLWLSRLRPEHDNMRAALGWALEHQAHAALRLSAALTIFWLASGHLSEGRRWLEQALAAVERQDGAAAEQAFDHGATKAAVLAGLGQLAFGQGDIVYARGVLEQSVSLARQMGNTLQLARALAFVAVTSSMLGDLDTGRTAAEESRAHAREVGDMWAEVVALVMLTEFGMRKGDPQAQAYLQEAVQLSRQSGNPMGMALTSDTSARVAVATGHYAEARSYFNEAVELYRSIGNQSFAHAAQSEVANLARLEGNYAEALALYRQTMLAWQELGHRSGLARCLECLALIAEAQRQPLRAVRLFGVAAALRETISVPPTPEEQTENLEALDSIHTQLDEGAFQAAWADARQMTTEQAVAYALSDEQQ